MPGEKIQAKQPHRPRSNVEFDVMAFCLWFLLEGKQKNNTLKNRVYALHIVTLTYPSILE